MAGENLSRYAEWVDGWPGRWRARWSGREVPGRRSIEPLVDLNPSTRGRADTPARNRDCDCGVQSVRNGQLHRSHLTSRGDPSGGSRQAELADVLANPAGADWRPGWCHSCARRTGCPLLSQTVKLVASSRSTDEFMLQWISMPVTPMNSPAGYSRPAARTVVV